MSKSYGNTIPLFGTPKQLQKSINKVKTNLLEPGEPKDADDSTVFQLWCAFADEAERARMRQAFADGIAWGEAKKQLFERVNDELAPARARYDHLMAHPGDVEAILANAVQRGSDRKVKACLRRYVEAVGLRPYR